MFYNPFLIEFAWATYLRASSSLWFNKSISLLYLWDKSSNWPYISYLCSPFLFKSLFFFWCFLRAENALVRVLCLFSRRVCFRMVLLSFCLNNQDFQLEKNLFKRWFRCSFFFDLASHNDRTDLVSSSFSHSFIFPPSYSFVWSSSLILNWRTFLNLEVSSSIICFYSSRRAFFMPTNSLMASFLKEPMRVSNLNLNSSVSSSIICGWRFLVFLRLWRLVDSSY